MKRFFSVLMAFLLLTTISAQESDRYRPVFGIRTGIDVNLPSKLSGVTNEKVFNAGAGAEVGAVCRLPFLQALYVEPALSFVFDQYSCKEIPGKTNYGNVYKYGLRIPVLLGYNFNFAEQTVMSVFTGPEFNYAFAGSYSKSDNEVNPFNDPEYGQKRFNMVWDLGIGIPVKNILISVTGAFGLTNLWKSSLNTFHEYRISTTLTYYF